MSDAALPLDAFEEQRVTELRTAQTKAEQLFREVENRNLIRCGVSESRLNAEVYELAKEMFGITTFWHKRIVSAGRNTLAPYDENPPDLMIAEDDILFLDLGPVFEDWEADFGRTFVFGSDPLKLKLRDDVATAFAEGKRYFNDTPNIIASQLFAYAVSLAHKFGWDFGGRIAGHLIGQFPHDKSSGGKVAKASSFRYSEGHSRSQAYGSFRREANPYSQRKFQPSGIGLKTMPPSKSSGASGACHLSDH